jgi:DNA-binding MarR family transcriptional regulator
MIKHKSKELTDYYILKTLENDDSVSQRKLSSQMEINVASVNFAFKRLIKKGLVKMVGINPKKIRYHITSKGIKEKTRMAYNFFGRNFHFYKEVRSDIEMQIKKSNGNSKDKVAIYGVRELAEIAYMAVISTRLEFVGFFIDDLKKTNKAIFGHKVREIESINKLQPCLLLITERLPKNMISCNEMKSINYLNLRDWYKTD